MQHWNKLQNRWKINLHSHRIECGIKTFETIDKIELSDLLKV